MNSTLKTTLIAMAFAVAAGSGSAAFAKAHDQGVADGEPTPANTGAFVQSLGGNGVSGLVNKGARGSEASDPETGRGNLSVDPVVGNGNNAEPD